MKKVLYPGSFDPMTKGHMDIVNQASLLFDEVVIAILQNSNKRDSFFTIEERVELIKQLYNEYTNIKVISGVGAAVDVALENECQAIVRGLRGITDFDYEIQLAGVNKDISDNKVNTVCFFADPRHQFVSSSMVKEVLSLNKDISKYVDPIVEDVMKQKVYMKKV